jgi:hypothetical protein
MAMSKKNYVAAAEIIAAEVDASQALTPVRRAAALSATRAVAFGLAGMFAADNWHFDRARFMDACGLGDPNGN